VRFWNRRTAQTTDFYRYFLNLFLVDMCGLGTPHTLYVG